MPIREYACDGCGLVTAKLLPGFSPPKLTVCTGCGKKSARLKFSAPSLISPKDPTRAPNPNTDVVIGKHAEEAWAVYDTFKPAKKVAATAAKSLGTGVTVDLAQSCTRPMTPTEMQQRKKAYKMLAETQRQQSNSQARKHR